MAETGIWITQNGRTVTTSTTPQRNHNETTTKPLTKPLVFSHTINETGGFYKQLIEAP